VLSVCLCVLTVQMAVGMGVQIMSVEWVEKCWDQRNDSLVSATDEHLVMCKKITFWYILCALNWELFGKRWLAFCSLFFMV